MTLPGVYEKVPLRKPTIPPTIISRQRHSLRGRLHSQQITTNPVCLSSSTSSSSSSDASENDEDHHEIDGRYSRSPITENINIISNSENKPINNNSGHNRCCERRSNDNSKRKKNQKNEGHSKNSCNVDDICFKSGDDRNNINKNGEQNFISHFKDDVNCHYRNCGGSPNNPNDEDLQFNKKSSLMKHINNNNNNTIDEHSNNSSSSVEDNTKNHVDSSNGNRNFKNGGENKLNLVNFDDNNDDNDDNNDEDDNGHQTGKDWQPKMGTSENFRPRAPQPPKTAFDASGRFRIIQRTNQRRRMATPNAASTETIESRQRGGIDLNQKNISEDDNAEYYEYDYEDDDDVKNVTSKNQLKKPTSIPLAGWRSRTSERFKNKSNNDIIVDFNKRDDKKTQDIYYANANSINNVFNRNICMPLTMSARNMNLYTKNMTSRDKDYDSEDYNSNNNNSGGKISKIDRVMQNIEYQKSKIPQTFVVVREIKKSAKKNHADFRMMFGDQAIFFSLATKDDTGQIDVISTHNPIVVNSRDNLIGIVRRHNRGKRFTLITQEEKFNDDREAELLGMAYVKIPDSHTKQKSFRVSFRDDERPNFPISKRLELSRIAESGVALPNIKSFTNKLPVFGPDGKVLNSFGATFVIDSNKNYVIEDKKNEAIYTIYKSAEGSFNVKIRYPFTPLMAFALSLCIIQDCRK